MKKFAAILLSALFILSLGACGENPATESTDKSGEDGTSVSADEGASGEETTAPATVLTDGKIIRGSIEENVFKNTSTGVRFKKPASWVFATDEAIANKFDISASQLDRNVFENTVAEMSIIYDMMATDPDTNATVVVAYENIALTYGKDITEEEYFEGLKKQLESTVMEITFEEKIKTENLNGFTYKKLESTNTTSGYSVNQTYYVRPVGNYFCTVLITTIGDGQISKIESMFS